jgi:electron transfer flavoprotein alpha subunit
MDRDVYVVIEHLRGQVADISYVMLAAARVLAKTTGGQVLGVLLGHDLQDLSRALACDKVLYFDDPVLAEFTPDAYQKVLTSLLQERAPRAVLLANSSIGADIAGGLSARLNLTLISSCQSFSAEGHPISQICGGKIMAECGLSDATTLLTIIPGGYKPEEGKGGQPSEVIKMAAPSLDGLRVTLKKYHEPEAGDVDIAKQSILVSVGRGIQNQANIVLAEDLAKALGGVVCGSRPIVDQGWLSASRLVGKSGKRVKPKIYLAFGISGAPEHVEAIGDSDMIIAINTDRNAPIFNVAKYGAEVDMFDLMPSLTERILQAKG